MKPNALTQNGRDLVSSLRKKFFAPRPTESPSVWAEKNFVFNEEQIKGRFVFTGREYLRRWIDDNNNENVREQTTVSGTGCGKTISYTVGVSWKIKFKPCRGICVYPSAKGEGSSANYVSTRLMPDILATPVMAALIPQKGRRDYHINKQFVRLNGSHFGFVGGNSAGQVAGNRCADVRIDETDKLPQQIKNEAGTGALVKNRTEGVTDWQFFDTSTPTVERGVIWKRLQRSNLHLRFLPCPHCNGGRHAEIESGRELEARQSKFKGWMVYAWSEQFKVGLPDKMGHTPIPYAMVKWDKKAKGLDGIWNYQKVQETAHFVCPHCKGQITDFKDGIIFPDVKNWMDENGCWICVEPGVPNHVGYHVSSLYAPVINEESTVGGRAVKFLSALAEGDLRDFINSTLALPEIGQQHADSNIIQIGKGLVQTEATLWLPQMSVDRQEKFPGFWYVVRNWIVSVLRPLETDKEKNDAFLKSVPGYSLQLPPAILLNLCRCDHWRKIAEWMIDKKMTGSKATEFLKKEFDGDLMRLIDFACKELKIKFPRQGDSEAVEIGSADSWEEIEEAQQRNKVSNVDLICDARFGSMDNAEVFIECFRRCPKTGFCFYAPFHSVGVSSSGRFSSAPFQGGKPFALNGWTPCVGYPEHKTWIVKDRIRLPYGQIINDPFKGKMEQKQFYQYVFQFDAQWSLDELKRIRARYRWEVSPKVKFFGKTAEMRDVNIDEYNRHMKGYYWDAVNLVWDSHAKKGGSQARLHPNHLYDCEKNMAARAVWKGVFKYDKAIS